MIKYVIKRDGRRAKFNPTKISDAITSAFLDKEMQVSKKELEALTDKVCDKIETSTDKPTVSVETIQDVVEDVLMSKDKYKEVAKAYILYRAESCQGQVFRGLPQAFQSSGRPWNRRFPSLLPQHGENRMPESSGEPTGHLCP